MGESFLGVRLLRKGWVFAAYVLVAVTLFVYRDSLIEWMKSETVWYLDILIWFVGLLIAFVPVIPYGIVAAIIGAKYGAIIGTCINVVISVLAAMMLFALVRASISEEGRRKTARIKGLASLTDIAERNAFFAILFARLLPIVPAQAINIFAAFTRMSWKPFLYATIIGKIPFILMVTFLGDRLINASDVKGGIIVILAVYGIFLLSVYAGFRLYRQRM
jgi:uncharacterized membrane protein YdjX (TVP38/TMEM64 family)